MPPPRQGRSHHARTRSPLGESVPSALQQSRTRPRFVDSALGIFGPITERSITPYRRTWLTRRVTHPSAASVACHFRSAPNSATSVARPSCERLSSPIGFSERGADAHLGTSSSSVFLKFWRHSVKTILVILAVVVVVLLVNAIYSTSAD